MEVSANRLTDVLEEEECFKRMKRFKLSKSMKWKDLTHRMQMIVQHQPNNLWMKKKLVVVVVSLLL